MFRDSVFRKSLGLAAMAAGAAAALLPEGGTAQPAPHFSSTYAASEGSPYKEVYGRTFGTAPEADPGPPLETAAPPADPGVVYVIEDGRLLTYSAADYAAGDGKAQSLSPQSAGSSSLGRPATSLPGVADHLYGAPPAETAAGPATPIRLIQPQTESLGPPPAE